eukprot:SAG22_NODE_1852_length_3441_cov_3.839019_3_plen_152_part_00
MPFSCSSIFSAFFFAFLSFLNFLFIFLNCGDAPVARDRFRDRVPRRAAKQQTFAGDLLTATTCRPTSPAWSSSTRGAPDESSAASSSPSRSRGGLIHRQVTTETRVYMCTADPDLDAAGSDSSATVNDNTNPTAVTMPHRAHRQVLLSGAV